MFNVLPENHALKFIMDVDFSFIKSITKNSYHKHMGRPSVDPEIFFRITLIGYLYGIKSDRRLCEEIQCNLLYRWFCFIPLNSKVPHYSSLSRIRSRLGVNAFQSIFDTIVFKCIEIGIVKGDKILTDASLIRANASLRSLHPKNQEFLTTKKSYQEKKVSETHISKTDPEASLARKNGKVRALRYKVHNAFDADSRIILDSKVTTGACHDSVPYLEQLKTISNRYSLKIREAIANRAYGSGDILIQLEEMNIKTFIPLFNGRTGTIYDLTKAGFIFDEQRDLYICPNNKPMLPYRKISKIDIRTIYRAAKQDCSLCSMEGTCLPNNKSDVKGKHIRRSIYQNIYDKTLTKMENKDFRARKNERFWKSEGIFAEAKNNHLLGQTRYRGINKTQIQTTIIATVQNIKRLMKHYEKSSME